MKTKMAHMEEQMDHQKREIENLKEEQNRMAHMEEQMDDEKREIEKLKEEALEQKREIENLKEELKGLKEGPRTPVPAASSSGASPIPSPALSPRGAEELVCIHRGRAPSWSTHIRVAWMATTWTRMRGYRTSGARSSPRGPTMSGRTSGNTCTTRGDFTRSAGAPRRLRETFCWNAEGATKQCGGSTVLMTSHPRMCRRGRRWQPSALTEPRREQGQYEHNSSPGGQLLLPASRHRCATKMSAVLQSLRTKQPFPSICWQCQWWMRCG